MKQFKRLFSTKKAASTYKKLHSVEPDQSVPPTSDTVPKKLHDKPAQTAPSAETVLSTDAVPKRSRFNMPAQITPVVGPSQTTDAANLVSISQKFEGNTIGMFHCCLRYVEAHLIIGRDWSWWSC
jgi:hypothetical protein